MAQEKRHTNPFLAPYNTPHETAPFDQIQLVHYEEAFMEGIRREDEEIEKIINDPAEPTFENTIARDDEQKDRKHYYDLLDRTESVFFNLLSAETNDEMDELAQKMSPILTKHANDISLNPSFLSASNTSTSITANSRQKSKPCLTTRTTDLSEAAHCLTTKAKSA